MNNSNYFDSYLTLKIHLQISEWQDLPFETDSKDRYVSAGSIEYWPEPQVRTLSAHSKRTIPKLTCHKYVST